MHIDTVVHIEFLLNNTQYYIYNTYFPGMHTTAHAKHVSKIIEVMPSYNGCHKKYNTEIFSS